MTIFKFIKEVDQDNEYDKSHVEMTIDTECRSDLLEEFKCFLLACGFSVNGELEIGEEE